MPGLLLDDGTFQLLAVPSRTTIGRGAGNDVQPDSQSISKSHGAIEISVHRGRMVTTIEDFDSRNGTFVGAETLEMERVKGKREIQYGYFLRFGNGGKFFRYLEEAPRDAVILDPSEPGNALPHTTRSLKSSHGRAESPFPARNPSSSLAIDVTSADAALAAPLEQRLVKSLPDFSSPVAENFRYAQPPQEDVKAMTISIQYPTSGRQALQPVTISIDPSQRQSGQGQPGYLRPVSRVAELEEQPPASSLYAAGGGAGGGRGGREEEASFKEDEAAWDEARLFEANGLERLPPPLSSDWEPPLSVAKGSLPPLHPGGISRDGRQPAPAPAPSSSSHQHRSSRPQSHSQSPPRSLSPARARAGSAYQSVQPAPDKPLAKLVRRLFLPVDGLPMTALVDSVLEKMVGLPGDSPPRSRADAPLPQLAGPAPDYLLAEAAADRFHDSDASACGQLGGVISDLSDFFRQAIAGAQIVGGDASPASAELDNALLGVITTILADSIETLQGVCYGSLVQAFQDAHNDGCENCVKDTLERSLARLDKLRLFVNHEFCKELCDAEGMTPAEMYCIAAVGLDFVLSDLDSANAIVWGVCSKLDLPRALPVASPPEEAQKPSRGRASATASAEGPVLKTALSCELDELRRLKSKAGARGASAAMAAQIALLEREKVAKEASAGGRAGGRGGKGADMKGAMDRLQQQEQVGGSREARVLRVLNTCDDALTRWQVYALLKWRNIVAAIKSNFASKLKRFGRLLQVRRLGMLARCFRRWDKTAALLRTDLLIEQETAKLKYEMCGMEARIHELSSGNALAASLAAERALNKELAGTNMELRLGVQELDAKLLECANAPPASRKALVRDVFYGREDEIAHSRREAKTLREELQRLYDLGIEAVAERASQRILPRAPVPPEYRDKQERAAAPLRDRADRADRSAHPHVPGSPPRSLSPTERPRPPPLVLQQKGPQGRELPTMKKGGYPPPVMTRALTRADATMVIAQEVRRLASTVTALQEEREELRIKVRPRSSPRALCLQ